MQTLSDENIIKVIKIIASSNPQGWWAEDIVWWTDGEDLRMSLSCSDWFQWATADAEEITDQTVQIFENACSQAVSLNEVFLGGMYASMVREQAPMPPRMVKMSPELRKYYSQWERNPDWA